MNLGGRAKRRDHLYCSTDRSTQHPCTFPRGGGEEIEVLWNGYGRQGNFLINWGRMDT